MNSGDAQVECGEFGDLVFHERDEGRDDEGRSAESDGGELIAERLPCPGWHHKQQVAAIYCCAAYCLLVSAEPRKAKGRLQKLGKVFRIGKSGQNAADMIGSRKCLLQLYRNVKMRVPAAIIRGSDESGTTTPNLLQSNPRRVPTPKDSPTMKDPQSTAPRASLTDYLAAERTLLAWIRTGLAMMGFGFVVARFGLFLQELQVVQKSAVTQHYGLSLWFGTALIAVGVVVNVVAGWHHLRLIRQLDRGETTHTHATAQAVTVAFLLALVGLAMAIYLVSVRGTATSGSGSKKEVSLVEQQRHSSNSQPLFRG